MLGAVDLGRLDAYMAHIKRYAARYSGCWSKIYEAEVKMRSDQMDRIKRDLEEAAARAAAAGKAHDYDPTRPWDAVWAEAISASAFWRSELEEPCLVILAKAPISSSSASPSAEFYGWSVHG
eukprot:4219194-Amphidinium_carterae.1